jgi:Spy/CpxP family protein refolding chaperone
MLPKSKIRAIALLVAVGVAGFAAGAATMSRAETRAPTDWRERCSYSGMLKDRLNLSAAQQDSIRAIMRAHRVEMHALFEHVRPQMDSVRAVVRGQVRALLTPAQQLQYDSLETHERAERAERARMNDSTGRAGAPGPH